MIIFETKSCFVAQTGFEVMIIWLQSSKCCGYRHVLLFVPCINFGSPSHFFQLLYYLS